MELGANINFRDGFGMTPLDLAVYRDDHKVINKIDRHHKNNDSKNNTNRNLDECRSGRTTKSADGTTSLKGSTTERGLEDVAISLVRLGCELGTEAQARQLIWHAASNGWHDLLNALCEHPSLVQSCPGARGRDVIRSDPHWHGCAALWIAAQRGHVKVVQILLKAASNPNKTFSAVRTKPKHTVQLIFKDSNL